MIKADQPKIFGSHVSIVLTSVDDGNMKSGIIDGDAAEVNENRRKVLSKNMIAMQSTILCNVTYDRTDFTQYTKVRAEDRGRGMMPDTTVITADGLATDERRTALFLPLADCIGAVLYDPARTQPRLMLAHFGRHTLEQSGVEKCVQFMRDSYGSQPADLLVWLGPAPNGTAYPLWQRANQSFREAALSDLAAAGITANHIEISDIDTVSDHNYFSHSEFLKGNRSSDGRYAIVAMIR